MTYLIYGEDQYRVREQVEIIRNSARQAGVSIVNLEAEKLSPRELDDHIGTSSLFTKKTAVFIKNLLSRGSDALVEGTVELVKSAPDGVTLVIWEEGIPDRRSRHFRALTAKAKVLENAPLKGHTLTRWIADRAGKKGMHLTNEAVIALASLVASDLALAENELDKLALYSRGGAVTDQDVLTLVSGVVSPSIFDLLDAVGERDEEAINWCEKLLESGEEPLHLLSMLAYQIRNLLLVRDLVTAKPNVSPYQVAKSLSLHPFVAQKTLAQAKSFSGEELDALHRKLTDLDHAIKTGRIEASDALVLFATAARVR